MVERRRRRECRQVVRARLGCRFVAGREPDQRRLAEGGAEEADTQGYTEHRARRHLHDGISRPGCEARGSEDRSEEHTSELQSQSNLVCRLLLEKKKPNYT